MTKQLHLTCTARGAHCWSVRDVIFKLLFSKATIFRFLGVQVSVTFYVVWKISLLFTAHVMTQNMERRKSMVKVLAVADWCMGHQSPLPVTTTHQCGPCWPKILNNFFYCLEPLRVIIALIAFKIPYNSNCGAWIPLDMGFELHSLDSPVFCPLAWATGEVGQTSSSN